MHLLVLVALVTASCLCAAPISAVAAQGGVVVRGTVTVPSFNRDQRPEPDIEVALINAAGERRSVVTKIDGVFEFPQIPPGQYTLRIDLPQYVAYRQEITVGATAPPEVAIKLFSKGMPWQKLYVKAEYLEPVNAYGGHQSEKWMQFGEEVLVIKKHGGGKDGVQVSGPKDLDILRERPDFQAFVDMVR